MRNNFGPTVVIAAMLAVLTAPASWAADAAMQKAAKERHENFHHLGDAFEGIEKEAKKRKPDMTAAQKFAADIDRLAQAQSTWFPVGSGPDDGIKTKAKAEVWTKPAEFQAIHERFLREAAKLKDVAAGVDAQALAAQVETTGQTCSDCHIGFRKKGGLLSLFGD